MDRSGNTGLYFGLDMVCDVCRMCKPLDDPGYRPAHPGPHDTANGRSVTLDLRAVTAVEYGIAAAFLCLTLLGIFSKFGGVLATMFASASSGI